MEKIRFCKMHHLSQPCSSTYSSHGIEVSRLYRDRYDSFEKTLMLGKIEGRRRKGQQRMRCLDGITD